jgi:putative hydrolase of the HAD superfamily
MIVRALLFDLDDTLFSEREYVESGFRAVAKVIAEQSGGSPACYFEFMRAALEENGRGRIFDDLLVRFSLSPEKFPIDALVMHYRQHDPLIKLYPGVSEMLRRLRRTHRLAIVTDGMAAMQRRKVAALRLNDMIDEAIYCWEIEAPKPSPDGFLAAMRKLAVTPAETIIIGDRPDHDLAAAISIGCSAILIQGTRFAHLPAPDHPNLLTVCADVTEIESLLP